MPTNLIVERSARINGDSVYGTMSIESGAQVDGRLASRTGKQASTTPDLKVVADNAG